MSLATFPLIAWGDPDDISGAGYSTFGTLGSLTAVADPFGGTSAYTVDDNDAAAYAFRYKALTLAANGVQQVLVFVKEGTATTSEFYVLDETVPTSRLDVSMTWSGGVPVPYAAIGSVLGPVAVGGGWYALLGITTAAVAANNNSLLLYGATGSLAATGTTLWYVRNAVLLDYVDDYRRFADKRSGYDTVEGASGVRDAWDQGTNYVRRGTVQWVPATARSTPAIVSGFTGANESAGVNCGVQAMLLAGMQMTSMVWVPDRSACSVNQSVYLTQPTAGWEPTQQPNGDLTFPLELVATSAPGAVA